MSMRWHQISQFTISIVQQGNHRVNARPKTGLLIKKKVHKWNPQKPGVIRRPAPADDAFQINQC
jgi:hypothetical protein